MRLWRKLLRKYFTFNNREKRGLYVLIIVLLILTSVHLIKRLKPATDLALSDEQIAIIARFENANQYSEAAADSSVLTEENSESPEKPVVWKTFDPNSVDSITLIDAGLDARIARRLINYRKSGGRFRSAEDLSKIYGMDSVWLTEAMGFVQIQSSIELEDSKFMERPFDLDSLKKKEKRQIPTLELNKADSASFVQLPWVGPFYASEIVKLRENLGGFRTHNQLLSIYKIKDQTFESLLEHTTLDTSLINKININRVTLKQLGYHPYLTWKQARIIINYREQHGDYKTIKEIMNTRVITDSVYLKIAPYLTISE